MANPSIQVKVKGLTQLVGALQQFPREINAGLADAATLVGDRILNTVGLKKYPPSGPGNQPPTPYYIRGRGTQTSVYRNLGNSEKMGSQFYSLGEVRSMGGVAIVIGNGASYAPYVVGEDQSAVMAKIGWRKLLDVAKEKVNNGEVAKVFETVIAAVLKKLGL